MNTLISTDTRQTVARIATLNAVEGFDPTSLAVTYTDLGSGGACKRLPVMAQLAWFRLRYPDGRIAISATPADNGYIAKARIYKDYKDSEEHFISEAEAFRACNADKPSVSPLEWAQTAAIGIALRNAGFGLQFHAAGDGFDFEAGEALSETPVVGTRPATAASMVAPASPMLAPLEPQVQTVASSAVEAEALPNVSALARAENPLEQAMKTPCPIAKYSGKVLGDLIMLDPGALAYIARSEKYDPAIVAAAVLICEHAVQRVG